MSKSRFIIRPNHVAWLLIGLLGICVGAMFGLSPYEAARIRMETTPASAVAPPTPQQPEGIDRRQLDGNQPIDPNAYLNRTNPPANSGPPHGPPPGQR